VKLLFPDRVLQQELLLALQFGDVERPGQAALQPSAEKIRREAIGAGDIDLGDASLDRRSVTTPFSTFWSGIVIPELM
jgi:hypothetical protein